MSPEHGSTELLLELLERGEALLKRLLCGRRLVRPLIDLQLQDQVLERLDLGGHLAVVGAATRDQDIFALLNLLHLCLDRCLLVEGRQGARILLLLIGPRLLGVHLLGPLVRDLRLVQEPLGQGVPRDAEGAAAARTPSRGCHSCPNRSRRGSL